MATLVRVIGAAEHVRLRARWWVAPLIGWTLFLWISRTRNVLANDELAGWGTTWRVGAAIVFLALAIACGLWLFANKTSAVSLAVLSVWTVGYWLVRGGGILLDANHDAGFKAVHTVLMMVSLTLVAVALTGTRRASLESSPSW